MCLTGVRKPSCRTPNEVTPPILHRLDIRSIDSLYSPKSAVRFMVSRHPEIHKPHPDVTGGRGGDTCTLARRRIILAHARRALLP